jgi:murein DD-endopeptidase MepM/ murein hydrolase activator NlpD
MGGVITVQEKDEIESGYRHRLNELQKQVFQLSDRILEIKTLKDRFADLATPSPVKTKIKDQNNQGGPYQPILFKPNSKNSLIEDFEYALNSTQSINQSIKKLEDSWRDQYQWLSQLPTGSPIANQIGLSSNFGARIDPFTRSLAQHPGVDFSAPSGTPILASGDGVVLRAEYDGAYGNFIEIEHADQFVSKYAHARKLHVQVGQKIKRGQLIAEVGSTGRSTGAHLHYEISRNGTIINPMQILIARPTQLAQQ